MQEEKKISKRVAPDDVLYFLVVVYMLLWLMEGGLRRWVLPQLSNPLLLVRDPIAVAIYLIAFYNNRFPKNVFIVSAWILGIAEILFAYCGHANFLVALYGVRCDFLHVPMMFIIGRSLTREKLVFVCKAAVLLSIPYTVLLIAQFYSPQSAWVNRGLGGDLEGAGFSGALEKYRPPGTFSFISGPATLYPIFVACLYSVWFNRALSSYICAISAFAIAIAIPISISRGLFIGVLIVFSAAVLAQLLIGKLKFQTEYLFVALICLLVAPFVSQLSVIGDSLEAFMARWDASTTDNGGVNEAIFERLYESTLGVFFDPNIPLFGAGTGFSTNVGQKQLVNDFGFGMSEGEFGRLLYDNGFVLGPLIVLYRLALAFWISAKASIAFLKKEAVGAVFLAAGLPVILIGQWGQASIQGSAAIVAGLILGASKATVTEHFPEFAKEPRPHE